MLSVPVARRAARPLPERLAPGQPVGYVVDHYGRPYLLYGPDYSRRVVYLREETLEGLLARLRAEGLTTFYTGTDRFREGSTLAEGVRRGVLRPFKDGGWPGFDVIPAK